jgi:hypothetical protein
MRGRLPTGLEECLDKLEGDVETKERLKAVFDVVYGEMRLQEACALLNLGETRVHQLRETALRGALTAIKPKPAGRPSRVMSPELERIRVLEERVQELEQALHAAGVRDEVALVLQRPSAGENALDDNDEKKTPPRTVRIRKPR